MVNVALYIPPGAHSPALSITATSADPAKFRIDRIYLSRIGRNFGCLSAKNRLVNLDQWQQKNPGADPETYPAFSVDSDEVLGSSVTLTLGAVSNVGTLGIGTVSNAGTLIKSGGWVDSANKVGYTPGVGEVSIAES